MKSAGKQATLLQSWGYYEGVEKSRVTAAQPSCSSRVDDVVMVESDDSDDDQMLLAALDESMRLIEVSPDEIITADDVTEIPEGYGGVATETLEGFDEKSGRGWIFPLDKTPRRYQFDIAEKSLLNNTLVSLPTGLGKTFIAAVVMYNFYRWYPEGKVIFMAPTKPLVAQQIEACYQSMGIPQSDMAEMTGMIHQTKRKLEWEAKRVFFLTPQVLLNDLTSSQFSAKSVKCLVIDEAHKALGNHAYCQVVRELMKHTKNFRILALSATPGSDLSSVQQVLSNLHIAHLELRSEDSPDVSVYCHERNVEKIVVPLGPEVQMLRESFTAVLEGLLVKLEQLRVLHHREVSHWTQFVLVKERDNFRKFPLPNVPRSVVEGNFAKLISLYHAYELLMTHGIKAFFTYVNERLDGGTRSYLLKSDVFRPSYDFLLEKLTPGNADDSNGHIAEDMSEGLISHPKMEKLQEILLNHLVEFEDSGRSTRVMIFAQYRDSVDEICAALEKLQPIVKVLKFVGQTNVSKTKKGVTQKDQLKVVEQFKSGEYNTLVCTCIGEEGLDIGEVDLIICYDSPTSPTRLVQRMGRTGRARKGKIVVLLTEGREEQRYSTSLHTKKSIHKAISGHHNFRLYQENPRMVPLGMTPICVKVKTNLGVEFQTPKPKRPAQPRKTREPGEKPAKRLKKGVRGSTVGGSQFLTEEDWVFWEEKCRVSNKDQHKIKTVPPRHMLSLGSISDQPVIDNKPNRFSWAEPNIQSRRPKRKRIGRSSTTGSFLNLLEVIDYWKSRDPQCPEVDHFFKEKVIGAENRRKVEGIRRFCQPNVGPKWNPPRTKSAAVDDNDNLNDFHLPIFRDCDFMSMPNCDKVAEDEEFRRTSINPLINIDSLIRRLREKMKFEEDINRPINLNF